MIVEIAFEAIGKILGESLARRDGVQAVVREVIRGVREREHLVVRVSPRDHELLAREGFKPKNGDAQAIELLADDRVELGGCLIETAGGTLDGRLETQLQAAARYAGRRGTRGGAGERGMSARGRSEALIRSAQRGVAHERARPLRSAHPAARSAEGHPERARPLRSAHPEARSAEGSSMTAALRRYAAAVRSAEFTRRSGSVSQFFGLVVESNGPDAFLGEVCEIYSRSTATPIAAEVVGLKDGKVLLMPYGELRGIGLGCEVLATGRAVEMAIGEGLLGRVIDAFGRPLDGRPLPPLPAQCRLTHEPLQSARALAHPARARDRREEHRRPADDRPRPARRHLLRQRRRQEHAARA